MRTKTMIDSILERFLNDVKNHQLTIHQNNGVYRHLTFKNPESTHYYFNITTYPEYLVITGDMGSLIFSRLTDMFNFFRSDDLRINPSYWSEKIESTGYDAKLASYSEFDIDIVEKNAQEDLNNHLDENDTLSSYDRYELTMEFDEKIMCASDEWEIVEAIRNFNCNGFKFVDFWESDPRKYLSRYIWLCYAIVWGIKKFDEATDVTENEHEQ